MLDATNYNVLLIRINLIASVFAIIVIDSTKNQQKLNIANNAIKVNAAIVLKNNMGKFKLVSAIVIYVEKLKVLMTNVRVNFQLANFASNSKINLLKIINKIIR